MPDDPLNNDFNEDFNEDKTPKRGVSSSLDKNQKIAVAVLAVFAFFIIIIWAVQFKRGLSEPFIYKGEENVETRHGASLQENSEEALKAKDTDKDGLSDWDELNTYKTSPYLEDSDSDGFSDKEEIDNGKDPNCPAGRECYGQGGSTATGTPNSLKDTAKQIEELNNLLNQINSSGQVTSAPASGDNSLLQGKIDAASLRQLLLAAGMDKKVLDQISDQELMNSYGQMLSAQKQ